MLFSLSSSFRLSVKVHACLCSLFFAPVNVFLGLCLAPLSLSIVSILLIFLSIKTLREPPQFLPSLPHTALLFLALSYLLVSEASFPLSIFLLRLSTFSLHSRISCSIRVLFSPSPLSVISALHTFALYSHIGWSQWLFSLSLSPCSISVHLSHVSITLS